MKALGREYLETLATLINKLTETQLSAIEQAAEVVAKAIANGNVIHVFGLGHSHILAEEAFFRAGGLAPMNAILEPCLMLHTGAVKSSRLENVSGIAEILLDTYEVREGDVLIVVSNSGINVIPIEMAAGAKKRGVFTIAITNVKYSRMLKGGAPALFEIANLVIDNLGEPGDAIIEVPGLAQRVGPTSTVVGTAIINAIVVEAVHFLWKWGIAPPVFVSSHLPGAMETNMKLVQKYRGRIKLL